MHRTQSGQFFDHPNSFATTVSRLVREIAAGLAVLHRVQYAEPWKQQPTRGA